MVRMLYSLGVLALLAAGTIIALCLSQWLGGADCHGLSFLDQQSLVEQFRQRAGDRAASPDCKAVPLVVQAEAFASYLNPPKPALMASEAATPRSPSVLRIADKTAPRIRPATPSVQFELHGTSYCPSQPERSMALIAEHRGAKNTARWVKEGTRLGHFVIHEIQRSGIVYRDGEQLHEVPVRGRRTRKSLVRRVQQGSRQVSAATVEGGAMLPLPTGPNSVGAAGGN